MHNHRGFPTRTIVVVASPAKAEAPVEAAPIAQKNQHDKPKLKGFGSAYLRGRIWWIGYWVRGKWLRESSKSDKEADAMRLLKERWKQVGKGRFIGPSEERVTIDSILDGLATDYTINQRRSAKALKWKLRHLLDTFGGMKAVDVTEDLIERYKLSRLQEKTQCGGRPTKPATVNRELAALRRAFRIAVRQKRIAAAPTITMLEENSVRQGFVEPGDFDAIVENLPEALRDFARFGYSTGWRRGELQTLAWRDVNRDAQTILLRSENSKNKEPREITMDATLAEIIERRWDARVVNNPDGSAGIAEFVFHLGDGRPVGDFRKMWRSACNKAGMAGLLFHDLRRSAVRNMDREGVGQSTAMKITGHKTVSVYQRYRIVSQRDIQEALERTNAANARKKERRVVPIGKVKEGSR